MEFTPENVEAAVQEFYVNTGKVNKEVHEWLKLCQSSREAWTLVWTLLDPQTKSIQVQFLAANIIHFKVSRCLGEIPEGEYAGLKDRLVGVVAKYIAGPPMVLTRLCLTLGAFVLNTIGTVWANPLDDLAATFAPQNFPGVPEATVLRLLVQVFGHIPEQATSLASVAKGQAYRELQGKGQMMYSWLFNVAQTKRDNRDLVLETFRALNSWMKMICVFEWSDLFQLVDLVCNAVVTYIDLNDGDVSDVTIEILSGLIGEPQAHQYPGIMLKLLDKIVVLHPSLGVIMQRDDMEMASSFYGMYVAFADCHSKLVVEMFDPDSPHVQKEPKYRDNALMLIKILLECTDYPGIYPVDEIVSSLTISVWYSLVEDIQGYQSEGAKYVRIIQVFEEVYQTLAKILIKKAQYPEDMGDWNSEEKEMFRVYRQDVCDCITYCFELRGWTMLNELVDWAEAHLNAAEQNTNMPPPWPELESILLGIRAVSENISDETDPVVATPMNRIFSVIYRVLKMNRECKSQTGKSPNPKLFQAAIECISSCSGMLHMFDSVVKNIVGFILEGLFQPEIITAAALAMKTLSRDCTKNLSEFTPQILTSCKQALTSGKLSPNDCNRVVYCVGRFLPYLPTQEHLISAVNEIFAPCLNQLQTLALQEKSQDVKPQLISLLNVFSTLCLSLDGSKDEDSEDEEGEEDQDVGVAVEDESLVEVPTINNNDASQPNRSRVPAAPPVPQRPHPLIPVVEQILPVLIPVAEKWAKDEDTVEALFSIVKHTLTTIHNNSMIALQYAIQLVLISFRLNPLTSATNVGKQTILMLGKENRPIQTEFLSQMHNYFVTHRTSTLDPEFTESYLQFIGQMMKSDTELISLSGISLEPLLSFAIDSLGANEIGMVKAAIFLSSVAVERAARLNPPMTEFYRVNKGEVMVQRVLQAIGFTFPRAHCQHFAELMLVLSKTHPVEWRKWLTTLLQGQGFPSPHITQEQKQKFYMKVTRSNVNKRAIQDAIGEFAVACRNMSGSEYAAATSKQRF